ncbi:MAG TPA: hypothetical protein ENI29_07715 [bacterium]|nr:hypothetical protein [bacterium]
MPDFIYDFFIITIIGGVIVGLILLAINKIPKINFKTLFLKRRIRRFLKKYEEIKLIPEKEKKKVRKFGTLLDNGREKLEKLGFNIQHNGDTIKNNFFGIHLTRRTKFIYQFLIRRLDKGQTKRPDEAYFSEGYPESQKESSITQVLYDSIEYLRNKRISSNIFNFLRIKKKE